jgi:N-acetylglutamate synthase-like GNAT family acetyltransferase
VAFGPREEEVMSVHVRPASLQDGLTILNLLEDVGYFPEPISFAKTYRKTLTDPHFLVRVAEVDGRIVGVASLSLRYQIGLGGLLACLDELAIAADAPEQQKVNKALLQATVGKARGLGARRIALKTNEGTTPRPASLAQSA